MVSLKERYGLILDKQVSGRNCKKRLLRAIPSSGRAGRGLANYYNHCNRRSGMKAGDVANFLKYLGNWQSIPVDAHELIALVALRALF